MATSSSSTHLQPHHGSAHNSHATSSSMSTNTDEKFQRLLRRMEHCAKAREASTRVLSLRFAERDVVRSSLQRESMAAKDAYHEADKQRSERWKQKLQKSPYLNDLSAEYEMLTEEQKIRDRIEKKKQYLMKKRQQDAETAVIQRMLNDKDELEDLRKEKRYLIQREKELQSVRDLEKTKAKCARVDAERRHVLLDREHALLQQRLKEKPAGHFHASTSTKQALMDLQEG